MFKSSCFTDCTLLLKKSLVFFLQSVVLVSDVSMVLRSGAVNVLAQGEKKKKKAKWLGEEK